MATLNCHCLDCQRSSGAPFASGFIVRAADVTISGSPKTYSVHASSGKLATRSFCADCGSPLFTSGEAAPEVMSIRFATLDDPS
ncbi:GFA family protein [Paraburkholderia sp. J69-2]|uniref:GFA family protein n=1 Tax=Paraburkholderia sp. J69-2 TaxID=2805437 RepID=UPI0039EE8E16